MANPIFDLKRYTTTGQLVDQSEASISSGILIGQSNYLHRTQSCDRDQSFVAEFMQRFVNSEFRNQNSKFNNYKILDFGGRIQYQILGVVKLGRKVF